MGGDKDESIRSTLPLSTTPPRTPARAPEALLRRRRGARGLPKRIRNVIEPGDIRLHTGTSSRRRPAANRLDQRVMSLESSGDDCHRFLNDDRVLRRPGCAAKCSFTGGRHSSRRASRLPTIYRNHGGGRWGPALRPPSPTPQRRGGVVPPSSPPDLVSPVIATSLQRLVAAGQIICSLPPTASVSTCQRVLGREQGGEGRWGMVVRLVWAFRCVSPACFGAVFHVPSFHRRCAASPLFPRPSRPGGVPSPGRGRRGAAAVWAYRTPG